MRYFTLLLIIICFQQTSCQDYGKLTYLEHLPETLEEVSGMELKEGNDQLFAINDSGNAASIFIYDRNAGLYSIESENLRNRDWEDLTIYEDSSMNRTFLYVGDFGNNENERRDLVIYEVDITEFNARDYRNVDVKEYPFYYDTQTDFPPKKKEQFYDCEAFVRIENYFYLFSKNRSKDFDGKTQVYRLKADGISKKAEFLTEIEICNDEDDCLVTSADVNNKGEIALLTGDKVFVISNYDNEFEEYDIKRYDLDHYSQKESIVFKEDDLLWISDEQTKNTGGNLYEFKLDD